MWWTLVINNFGNALNGIKNHYLRNNLKKKEKLCLIFAIYLLQLTFIVLGKAVIPWPLESLHSLCSSLSVSIGRVSARVILISWEGTLILGHGREVPRWWRSFLRFSIWLGPNFMPHHDDISPLFRQKKMVCLYLI